MVERINKVTHQKNIQKSGPVSYKIKTYPPWTARRNPLKIGGLQGDDPASFWFSAHLHGWTVSFGGYNPGYPEKGHL